MLTPLDPYLNPWFKTNLGPRYLYPNCNPFPSKGKPPPTVVPSKPYLNLFLNTAVALFLPDNPDVFSIFFAVLLNKVGNPSLPAK